MSTAATPADVIAVPKGGGALRGIGETFAPDLHTGTGNFTVPLALPPGRNGFQPHLNLIYSTGNGNGPFGLGWNLSIPGVSRKTFCGILRYNKSDDTLVLSGAEDLVLLDNAATYYRPCVEAVTAFVQATKRRQLLVIPSVFAPRVRHYERQFVLLSREYLVPNNTFAKIG